MRMPTMARSSTIRFTLLMAGVLALGACSADMTSPTASPAVAPTTTAAALSGYVVAEGLKPLTPLIVAKAVPADTTK